MGRTGRNAVMALAGLALVGSLLTACATKKATGTGTLGNASTGPTGSPGPGGGTGGGGAGSGSGDGGSGGGSTQGTSGGGGNTGSGGGGTGGGGTGGGGGNNSPSPQPSTSHTVIIVYPDYAVKATGNCHWIVDAAHHLSLWAEFTVYHQGLGTPEPLPFNVSNDKDSIGAYGTKPANFPVTFDAILTNNIQTFSQSAWPGHTVTVSLKISPSNDDHDAADNVATAAIQVPDGEPQRDLLNPLPCTAG